MTVKASWPAPPVEIDTSDPFGDVPARVEDVGVEVDLRDEDELGARLSASLDDECRLHNAGVSCPIKNRPDTSCHACPIAGRYGELCAVGRLQEDLCTRMVVIELGERR